MGAPFNTAPFGGLAAGQVGATAESLVYSALRLLGVIRAGQTASPEVLDDGLHALNDLIDSWSTERLMVYSLSRDLIDMTGADTYEHGEAGGSRPRIEAVGLISSGSETPVEVLTRDTWAAGRDGVWCDYDWPVSTLRVRPTPATGTQLVLYTWRTVGTFSDLKEEVALPPGYAVALKYCLAAALAPAMLLHCKIPSPPLASIEAHADRYKAAVKSSNITPVEMECDSAMLRRDRFDIYRG